MKKSVSFFIIFSCALASFGQAGLVDRIRRTIERLDTAPAKEALKATGTDGICVEGTGVSRKRRKVDSV